MIIFNLPKNSIFSFDLLLNYWIIIQGVLISRGFVIRNFDYPGTQLCTKFVIRGFSPQLSADWVFLKAKKTIKGYNSGPSLSAVLLFGDAYIRTGRNTVNNEGFIP